MPRQVSKLHFKVMRGEHLRFNIKFINKPDTNWVEVWEYRGYGDAHIGPIDIGIWFRDNIKTNEPFLSWLIAGETFKVECGGPGLIDYWGYGSPLYSEELVYEGPQCIIAELYAAAFKPKCDFKVE